MKCPQPQVLARLVRNELDAQEAREISTHAESCEKCKPALARLTSTMAAFADIRETAAPDIGALRGEALARWSRPEKRTSYRPAFAMAFGLAAAAAIALYVTAQRSPSGNKAAPAIAKHEPVSPAPKAVARETVAAHVTLLSGDVKIDRDGKTFAAQMSTDLVERDGIRTASAAKIGAQWGEGSGFMMLGGARADLSRLEPRTQRFHLTEGKIWIRVGPHQPGETLEVTTNAHRVTVVGTWFSVAAAGMQTTVEVLEGTVEVSELDGSSSTLLHAPARGVFGRGRSETHPLTAQEASQRRTEGELNLSRWTSAEAHQKSTAPIIVDVGTQGTLAVDGVVVGQTPIVVRRPIGRHYLEINRPGYRPVKKWYELGPESAPLREAMLPVDSSEMPAGEIEGMLKARSAQIRGCYERRLKFDHTLAGTVTLRLKVGKEGAVETAKVSKSTIADAAVGECLLNETRGWKFDSGKNATIVYPFVFRAEE